MTKNIECKCFLEEIDKWNSFSDAMKKAEESLYILDANKPKCPFPGYELTAVVSIPESPPPFQPHCEEPCREAELLVAFLRNQPEQGKGYFAIRPPFELVLEQLSDQMMDLAKT